RSPSIDAAPHVTISIGSRSPDRAHSLHQILSDSRDIWSYLEASGQIMRCPIQKPWPHTNVMKRQFWH
ncbi:MAG TPA: hypothetical protein DCQ47_07285, partial [Gammaproteobacteria bacterium]|nr:hypothetical protein [Gammaproteobacteria bacterium]